MIDVTKIRKDFPIYLKHPNLKYLDSAASALKTQTVVDAIDRYYTTLGVNVHRGAYDLAYEATQLYEDARLTVSEFIGASPDEIIFTKGTTSSLNMIANAYRDILKADDEIITTELEHHSSILPWMKVAQKTGAKLVYIPLNHEGRITVESFQKVLTDRTKVVVITHVSNAMGYLTPAADIIRLAHQKQAVVVLDGAQAVPHMHVDVKALDADYYAFSGHKMFGPSGVGVLYGKVKLLNTLEPFEFGGEMVDQVFKDTFTYKDAPLRFEAGTPVIAGAIGLSAAIQYIRSIGYDKMHDHTHHLHQYTLSKLKSLPGITLYNPTADQAIITFNVDGIHPHDIATMLDQDQVNVRAGHHCAQLVTQFLGVTATLRASFQIYNSIEDCDAFIQAVIAARDFFQAF
jgi:cysteine desulfurase/selenocysteine lyase